MSVEAGGDGGEAIGRERDAARGMDAILAQVPVSLCLTGASFRGLLSLAVTLASHRSK